MKKTFIAKLTIVAFIFIVCSLLFVACATEESDLKAKYEQEGFNAQTFSLEFAEVNGEQVDFVYHGLKDANSAAFEQVFVITFNTIEQARNYYDAHYKDSDKPNMIRQGKAVVYGTLSAVQLY